MLNAWVSQRASRCGNLHIATRVTPAGASLQDGLSQARKSALLGGAAALAGLLTCTGAQAQCTDNFNYAFFTGPTFGGPSAGLGSVISSVSTINTVNTAFLTSSSAFVSSPPGPKPDQQSGGIWGRAVGGVVDTTTSSTTTLTVTGLTGTPTPAVGQAHCVTKDRQTFAGAQFGYDLAKLNNDGTGANFHFGTTFGYLQAFTKDTTPAAVYSNPTFGNETSPAGTAKETTKVPFVGLYANYTQGHFFADAMYRVDFYQNSITDSLQGIDGLSQNARGYSLTGNVGYNMPLAGGWFIEPAGGIILSRVQADSLALPKFGTLPVGNAVQIDTIDSALGRASVSVGKNISSGGVIWQPYVTVGVVHEFAGDIGVTQTSGPIPTIAGPLCNPCLATDTFNTSIERIGTYGQYTAGTAVVLGNTGWLGYGRVDYRKGDTIEGVSGNVGLRYQW
jgi:Autotransporter beta-domain